MRAFEQTALESGKFHLFPDLAHFYCGFLLHQNWFKRRSSDRLNAVYWTRDYNHP